MKFHKKGQKREITQESQHFRYFVAVRYGLYRIKIDQYKVEIYQDKQYNANDGDSGYIFHFVI